MVVLYIGDVRSGRTTCMPTRRPAAGFPLIVTLPETEAFASFLLAGVCDIAWCVRHCATNSMARINVRTGSGIADYAKPRESAVIILESHIVVSRIPDVVVSESYIAIERGTSPTVREGSLRSDSILSPGNTTIRHYRGLCELTQYFTNSNLSRMFRPGLL